MIALCGIGWINKEEYMCVMKGLRVRYKDATSFDGLSKKGIFSYPFKNFGRFDPVSKMVCYSVALALKDADESYSPDIKKDMGIIGTNTDGSLQSDIDYFKDYVDCGRKLSRGNLFIYTLPTSPLAEAAIHFGLQGPLLYITSGCLDVPLIIRTAEEMMLLNETQSVLAGVNSKDEAVYFVFKKEPGSESPALCNVPEAVSVTEKGTSLQETAEKFLMLKKRKCLQ